MQKGGYGLSYSMRDIMVGSLTTATWDNIAATGQYSVIMDMNTAATGKDTA